MYLLLLVFGAVLTVAGLILAASGLLLQDRGFDASIVTPGAVAAVGGLLLIGLGLALRVLQRIERALAARPMPGAARLGEAGEIAGPAERRGEPTRIPVSSKGAARPQGAPTVAPAAAMSAPAAAEKRVDGPPEIAPEKIPAFARLEVTAVTEEAEVSLSTTTPSPAVTTSAAAAFAQADQGGRLVRRGNGPGSTRITPRLDMSTRSPNAAERPPGPAFDTLWPKASRPMRGAPPMPAPQATAPVAAPEPKDQPAAVAPQTVASDEASVSVLKSGVVDGMPYTLFSDGSIEAQLPQGTLRFGSITELRNHIEQSA